ncbi:hypothetical protein [Mycolicibacterium houstonense]|uniref:hypothetical protein n=1 Tax=Mycolicibacterium houstonense TaxID=146021 RepID=UPI0021F275F6|nr:hypothetical protein [Mycolicibacterium houstonense]
MTTFARTKVKTVVSAGLCATAVVTAVAFSPHAVALQLKTGGYKCAGAAGAAPAAPCAAPAVEAAGVVPPLAPPVAVPPGPLAPPPVVPPVPVAPPPVVPPVPLAPPVPVVPAAPAPVAAPAAAAPVAVAAGAPSGKGVPTTSPGGGPVAGTPTLPGPG